MLGFKEYLEEKILSIGLNPKHEKHREGLRGQIHDVIQKSYVKAGGYGGNPSGSDAESKAIHADIGGAAHIKATTRGGKVTHASLYKAQAGRKVIGVGTDGTDQGKRDLGNNIKDDHRKKRAWGEFSDRAETVYRKGGFPQVPSSQAAKLTGKKVSIVDKDRYSRDIGGLPHEKTILGHPK